MNVVDSSGWLEYFADAPSASFFSAAIEDTDALLVPTLSLFEVFKAIERQRGEEAALQAVATMQQGRVLDLSAAVAVAAARLSRVHRLPMADSVTLATARSHDALLWTQDADFQGLDGVRFLKKRRARPR